MRYPPAISKSISYGGIIHIRYKGRKCLLPLSLSIQAPLHFQFSNKNRRHPLDASCKKSLCMTSYGGIIRIRL